MKARVPSKKDKDLNKILTSGIVLSIGMIVKNEIKHIRNCLTALQPLMERVPSELIIADTGSTDGTYEVCREFTDKAFKFKWIDDFAAARNSTVERAKGMWYMFIDADEYLEKDVSAMVEFFMNPNNRALCATYIVRNLDYTEVFFSDFPAPRIGRNLPSLRFSGKIHECLNVPNEFVHLPTVALHYGYVYKTDEFRKQKWERNNKLILKELEENPNDVRALTHISDTSEYDKRKKYLFRALEILRKVDDWDKVTEEKLYRGRVFIDICRHVFESCGMHEEIVEYAYEYFSYPQFRNNHASVDMYALLADSLTALNRWQEAYDAYTGFFRVYHNYHNGTIDSFDAPVSSSYDTQPRFLVVKTYRAAVCLAHLGRYSEAHDIINNIDVKSIQYTEYNKFLAGANMIMDVTKEFAKYADLYRGVEKSDDGYKLSQCVEMIETYYRTHLADRADFIDKIAALEDDDLPLVRQMKLLKEEKDALKKARDELSENEDKTDAEILPNNWKEDFAKKIEVYWSDFDNLEAGQTEAVYLSMKYGVYFPQLIKKSSYDRANKIFSDLAEVHGSNYALEYIRLVMNWCDYKNFSSNIAEIFWAVIMLKTAVLRTEYLPYEEKLELYDKFTGFLADYVFNVYNSELLNDQDVEILPPLHRFGYFVGQAKEALQNNDRIGYIRNLKNGLSLCEEMKDVVAVFIKEFQKNLK